MKNTVEVVVLSRGDELIEVQVAHCDTDLGVRCTGQPNGPHGEPCEAPASLLLISWPVGPFDQDRAEVNPSCLPCWESLQAFAVTAPGAN